MRQIKMIVMVTPEMRKIIEGESQKSGLSMGTIVKIALMERYKDKLNPKPDKPERRKTRQEEAEEAQNKRLTCQTCGRKKDWSNKLNGLYCPDCETEPREEQF
jgi:hypothetical protein